VFGAKNLIGERRLSCSEKKDCARGFNARTARSWIWKCGITLLEKGRLIYLTEPLCAFRCHPDQQSEHNSKSNATLDDMALIFDDYRAPYLHFGWAGSPDHCLRLLLFVWKHYRKTR